MWLAYDEHLDSPVAIKVLADNWAGDLHVRQRFVEEGRFLRRVESPHVVAVYDAGVLDDDRPYLVMAYADQGTLADRLDASPLDVARALRVVTEVGRGLSALHDRGVLHRDVKPANVLFRTVETAGGPQVLAMVGDLGLGKAMDMSSRLTMIGGTPTYVAPEQARGEGLDPRADQFSLAALAYLLLTGRQPFTHTSLSSAADPAPPAPMGLGDVEVEAVVLQGLSKDRDDRFADVAAFTTALAEALDGRTDDAPTAWTPVGAGPTRTAPRAAPGVEDTERLATPQAVLGAASARRRRVPWLVAGVLALVVGGAAGWAVERTVTGERTLDDATRTLSVTVPVEWTDQIDPQEWTPLEGGQRQPALAAGSGPGWNTDADPAPGVFIGLLAGDELPERVPQHPGCDTAPAPIYDEDGDDSVTVFFSDCPGADITAERVVRVTADLLLWVQVRSDDRGTADRVLESVRTGV